MVFPWLLQTPPFASPEDWAAQPITTNTPFLTFHSPTTHVLSLFFSLTPISIYPHQFLPFPFNSTSACYLPFCMISSTLLRTCAVSNWSTGSPWSIYAHSYRTLSIENSLQVKAFHFNSLRSLFSTTKVKTDQGVTHRISRRQLNNVTSLQKPAPFPILLYTRSLLLETVMWLTPYMLTISMKHTT